MKLWPVKHLRRPWHEPDTGTHESQGSRPPPDHAERLGPGGPTPAAPTPVPVADQLARADLETEKLVNDQVSGLTCGFRLIQ